MAEVRDELKGIHGYIDLILERWKRDRDVLRARGAGMNYEAIRHMEKEVLAILEKA